MGKQVKRVFTSAPIVSSKSSRKLSSYLVRSKLYPLNRKAGSFKCFPLVKCVNVVNVTETDTFTNAVTGESFKINHSLNCHDECLIYFLLFSQFAKFRLH